MKDTFINTDGQGKIKLYLNYSLKVKEYWLKDTVSSIKTANEYWPSLNK